MKSYRALVTFGTLALTLGWGTTAHGSDEIALSFALEPVGQDNSESVDAAVESADTAAIATAPPIVTADSADAPLPIPPGAENPPMSGDTTFPAGVYGGMSALALGTTSQPLQALLPPPPPAPTTAIQVAVAEPPTPSESADEPPSTATPSFTPQTVGLTFQPEKMAWQLAQETAPADTDEAPKSTPQKIARLAWDSIQTLFDGGTDSLVARAVGSAEGTRTPEGHKNPAYFGHTDPGNGVWNLGTFSYQHGALTPEEADAKQLERLKRQTQSIHQKAQAKDLELSPEELLNAIDLANQAPEAALDQRGSYLDWLKEAHDLGMSGSEAIVWARTRSFIDPDTQRWNAPGLGNNIYSISHDQERRANAIARAISATPTGLTAFTTATAEITGQSSALLASRAGADESSTAETASTNDKGNLLVNFDLRNPSTTQPPATVKVAQSGRVDTVENRPADAIADESSEVATAGAKPTPESAQPNRLSRWFNSFWQGPEQLIEASAKVPEIADSDPSPFFEEASGAIAANPPVANETATPSSDAAISDADLAPSTTESPLTTNEATDATEPLAFGADDGLESVEDTSTADSSAAPSKSGLAPAESVAATTAESVADDSLSASDVLTAAAIADLSDTDSDATATDATLGTPATNEEPAATENVDSVTAVDPKSPETASKPAVAEEVASTVNDEAPTSEGETTTGDLFGLADLDAGQNNVTRTQGLLPAVKQSALALKQTAENATDDVIKSLENIQKDLKTR